jgi:hypothetical protein
MSGFDNNLSNLPPGVSNEDVDGTGFFCEVCEEEITEAESDEQEGMCATHYEAYLNAQDDEDYEEEEDF